MGRSCFDVPFVIGFSRVPEPPAKIIPLQNLSAPGFILHNFYLTMVAQNIIF